MWNNFEQSALEDETICDAFSSRGIFKISSDEQVHHYPKVQASVQNNKMVIAIDKTIVLLENEMVAKCSIVNFSVEIDVMAISDSGNIIVCGLRDGEIHGIFIKGRLLFNLSVEVDDVHITSKTFAGIDQIGNQFYLCCSNGSVYQISEIDESPLLNYLNISINENETDSFVELFNNVTIEKFLPAKRCIGDASAVALIPKLPDLQYLLYIGASANALYFRQCEGLNKVIVPDIFKGIKYIYNLDKFIIALTNSGHLVKVCPLTKMINTETDQQMLIDEIIIMECSNENIELLVLTKKSVTGERIMRIIQYPSFKCNSELELNADSWLVEQPKGSVNLYYLGGEDINDENIPTAIEMKLISETHPSERFKKLIAKGHLEEAEDFGNQFELNLQPIYEAKAKRLLLEMYTLSENDIDLLNQHFANLCSLMNKIEDRNFFKSNRTIPLPSRVILTKYLKEVIKHLDEKIDNNDIMEILEQQRRLGTLSIIDPYDCNMDWQKFVFDSNLIKTITTLFKSDILSACFIWKRHSSSLMPVLNDQELRKLLNLIPSKAEAFSVVQWLRQFVPTVGNTHPDLMPFITHWSIQRTRALQHSADWPEIGLEFSTKVAEIFEDLQFLHSDLRRQHERNILKLRELVNALQDLSVLKKSYNLTITLDNYLQDSIDETAFYILQRVHLDNIKSLVNDFIYPIFQERGQSPVPAIRQYISLLVANRNSFSSWLPRAILCIELLHNEDDRLESALLVLQSSPVPWPEILAPLIKLRYSTHPLALKINTEYEIQVIKIMKIKYGWPAETISGANLNLFFFRVVQMDFPDMLDDIRVLTKAAPEIDVSANFNCCYQLVRKGKLDVAFEFFKTLKADKNLSISNIADIFAEMLENSGPLSNYKNIAEHRLMIEFYGLTIDSPAKERLRTIQNRFLLRHKFSLVIDSVSDMVSYENRMKLLNDGIENIIIRSDAAVNIIEFMIREISDLSDALSIGKVLGTRKICERIQCLPFSCALSYAILQFAECSSENKDEFVDLALVLLSQQLVLTSTNFQSTASKNCFSNYDPLAYPLAYELLVCALFFEQKNHQDIVQLLRFIRIVVDCYSKDAIDRLYNGNEKRINELVHKAVREKVSKPEELSLSFSKDINGTFDTHPSLQKRHSMSLFDNIEVQPEKQIINEPSTMDQMAVASFVSHTLLLMLIVSGTRNEVFNKFNRYLPDDIKEDNDGAHENFFLSLENSVKAKMHDVWYTIAQYLLEYQEYSKCKILNCDFVSLQLRRVFRSVLSHKEVNFIDLFAMLTADNHTKTLLENLSYDLKSDQQKVNFLTLSEMYNVHFEEQEHIRSIRLNRLKQYYYMEFCKQDPTIKGKFNADIDSIEQLLKEFYNKKLDVCLLERLCKDFKLDYQQMLISHVISILRAQEIQYEIKIDSFGDEELVMISTVEHIRTPCQPYLNEIKSSELLASKLKQFISEINIYFYELYLCVIEILSFMNVLPKEMQVWSSILHFLKHKMIRRRRNRPTQMESDMWLRSQKDMCVLPKVARYRLPFLPIVERPLKEILDNEVTVDNCESWFPLIQMHTVLKESNESEKMCDYFCMSAVQNSISDYKVEKDTETWHLQPTNNAFLKSIMRLVQRMQSPSKAFKILYCASNFAPEGADQVEATYECYKYAVENEKLLTDPKLADPVSKIKRKYPILKTQHLLCVYGLMDEKLMGLVKNPTELIINLYNHEIILKSTKLDINAVVKEIAELHSLEIDVLQFQLLQKWLSFSVETADGTILDETFFEDFNQAGNCASDISNTAENIVRANYILNSWPKQKAIQFLVAHIFPSDGSVNTSKQLQMYECFSRLNDGSASFSNVLSQRQYVTIKCVHELKQLGYKFSLEKFADCNKIEILTTIWQRNADNPHTLEILAHICLGFDIYIAQIWNGILKRMVKFNMVRELNALVDLLSCKPQLLNIEGLAIAWEFVLKNPFKNANQSRSFEQEEQLNKCLFRLQSCPVLHKLNLLDFAEQCIRLDRPHMAAILIAFTKNEKLRISIRQLVLNGKTEKLRKEILDLEDAGILPVIINVAMKELGL